MTFRYHFGDVALVSPVLLDGLRPLPEGKQTRHTIRLTHGGPVPGFDRRHYAWPGRYRLELGEHDGRWLVRSESGGAFLIERDVSAIHIAGERSAADPLVLDMFVRRVLPRALTLLGASVLHAASLANERGGVMLVGASGSGKSTLAAAMACRGGWHVLADDISVLWNSDSPLLAPAATGVRLRAASFEGLGLPPDRGEPLPGHEAGIRYLNDFPGCDALTPLCAMLVLRRSPDCGEPRVEALSRSDAMRAAVSQMVMFNPHGAAGGQRAELLTRLNAMLTSPAWRLTYPASYAALPGVLEAIDSMVASAKALPLEK